MADTHDPQLYFPDGNIVLSAKNSDDRTTYFRLYKGTLVNQSPVFADMFSLPPPPSVEPYDGVPLVEMPDNSNVLRGLMSLLFDTECNYMRNQAVFIYSILSRYTSKIFDASDFTVQLLEPTILAKKYQIDWIVKRVASQLMKRCPTTLGAWDRLDEEEDEEDMSRLYGGWPGDVVDETSPVRQFPEPVTSILLAHECDTPDMLPLAFFNLLAFPLISPKIKWGRSIFARLFLSETLFFPKIGAGCFSPGPKSEIGFWNKRQKIIGNPVKATTARDVRKHILTHGLSSPQK